VKFSIDAAATVGPDEAALAYATPAFFEGRAARDNIDVIEVVHHERDGERVRMEVRFRFSGAVSSAVRAVVDPKKMSWVTRNDLDLAARRSNWVIVPDYYPDRLSGRGTYTFSPGTDGPESATVTLAGELKVHVPLLGGSVERVIVPGMRSYFGAEVKSIGGVPLS
jgi:hypothetical protein